MYCSISGWAGVGRLGGVLLSTSLQPGQLESIFFASESSRCWSFLAHWQCFLFFRMCLVSSCPMMCLVGAASACCHPPHD